MFFLSVDFNILRPELGLILWTTIFFALFWFIIGRSAFKPITAALEKREQDIKDALYEAQKARMEISGLKSEHQALLNKASEERSAILREAKEAGDRMVAEAREKAKEESSRIVGDAMTTIENEKMAALIDIKNRSGKMALEIAEKILRKDMQNDPEQQAFMQKLVDEINLS
jgi:F-type H+-transporting ATPase subunit b